MMGAVFGDVATAAIGRGWKTQTRRIAKNLRVRLRHDVASDLPELITPVLTVEKGTHRVRLNPHGAVFTVANGMGLKPDEFDFLCPLLPRARTALISLHGWWVLPSSPASVYVKERWVTESGPVVRYADGAQRLIPAEEQASLLRNFRGNPRFMPASVARYVLEVTAARLQRIQDISEEDAIAEGVQFTDWGVARGQRRPGWCYGPASGPEDCFDTARMAFASAWNRLHGGERWNLLPVTDRPWERNDWVWAYMFRLAERRV